MRGDAFVIARLNAQLKQEFTAINQHCLRADNADRSGLTVRDGQPNLQGLGKLLIRERVQAVRESDPGLERGAQATTKDGVAPIDWLETQPLLIVRSGLQSDLQPMVGDSLGS